VTALLSLWRQEAAGYTRADLSADLMAGLTVAAVALPLALAFGVASGADAAAGLVTAIVGGIVIAVLGGARFQISGPTGAMSVVLIVVAVRHGLMGVWIASRAAVDDLNRLPLGAQDVDRGQERSSRGCQRVALLEQLAGVAAGVDAVKRSLGRDVQEHGQVGRDQASRLAVDRTDPVDVAELGALVGKAGEYVAFGDDLDPGLQSRQDRRAEVVAAVGGEHEGEGRGVDRQALRQRQPDLAADRAVRRLARALVGDIRSVERGRQSADLGADPGAVEALQDDEPTAHGRMLAAAAGPTAPPTSTSYTRRGRLVPGNFSRMRCA